MRTYSWTYFKAEKLKYRHTLLKGLSVLMPLICVFFAAWLTHAYFAIDSYNWWYMGLYPGLLGILCGIIGGKDKKKKDFTFRSLSCPMEKIWDAKVLVGAQASAAAMGCMVILTLLVGAVMERVGITFLLRPALKMQLLAGLVMWLTTLWQIPFCLFLSQKMGIFLMLTVHMGSCSLISILFSLKSWFALFPGAITARLMCPILGILPNGLPAVEGQMTYRAEMVEMRNLLTGIPAAIVWFLVFWLIGRKSFGKEPV